MILLTKYRNHIVAYGDTLQSISSALLNDVSRWVEIAVINDLEFPFISENGEPKTKSVGQQLLVPDEGQFQDVIPSNEIFDTYEDAMGKDISLFPEDDVFAVFSEETGEISSNLLGDINVVRGFRNLRQSLILRLSTPKGSLLHHPEYGTTILSILGKRGNSEVLHRLKIEIERAIRSDDRVEDITFDLFELDADTLRVSLLIRPKGFEEMLKLGLVTKGDEMSWD